MRFGLFMQPVHAPHENPTLALQRDLDLLAHLDGLGFDEAWIGEHHSSGWETISAPEVFMAVAAERTRHLKLGTGITPLPYHHPLLVADRLSLLDQLTRGRVMLGMGVGGGLPSDTHVLGFDERDALPRFKESFAAIWHLLNDPAPLSMKTDWFELREAVLQPPPFQRPHYPLAIATGNPDLLRLAGKHGLRILSAAPPQAVPGLLATMQDGADEVGRRVEHEQIALAVNVFLAPTRQEALDLTREGTARERFDFSSAVTGSPLPDVSRERWVEQLAQRPTDIIGTPEDAIEKIEAIGAQSGGVGGLLIRSKEWAPREATWRSYELFARFVMPRFQGSLVHLKTAQDVAQRFAARSVPAGD